MFSDSLLKQAEALLEECRKGGVKITVAESCTGGLLSALLTEIPGSSDVFDRGFITYSNAAKVRMLGVNEEWIRTHGAVSSEVATAMAKGALIHSDAHLSVAITGIAGPGGGTAAKPVGLVYIALGDKACDVASAQECHFTGNRNAIRQASLEKALGMLMDCLGRYS